MGKYSVEGMNKLAKEVAAWREGKGFKTPASIKESVAMLSKIMLVVTELAEAAEAVRHGDEQNFKEEIADTYIRLLDISGSYKGFDTESEIQNKMEVNEGRKKLHGKKC
jgi:NTP pyrophosphatase (non-canonical NTP hydrolase)